MSLSGSLFFIASIIAQSAVASPSQAQKPDQGAAASKAPSDEIVVTGLRDLGDLDDPNSPVRPETLGSKAYGTPIASRTAFALSQRFAKCAMDRSPMSMAALHATLDGRINGAKQSGSQIRLGQLHRGCLNDPHGDGTTGLIGYDGSYYDRGAMYIEAIKTFAPDLKLTRAQTADRAVQDRFNAREVSLAKFRLPVDQRYFEIAVCLVRMEPELSVRLTKTDSPYQQIDRLEAAIVNRAKVCVGNAKSVYFDPTQFRFYIADAVYRWAVAARGVDTLLPDK